MVKYLSIYLQLTHVVVMGVITLKLDDTLERKLRARAARVYGLARGSLSRAVEDAVTIWLQSDSSDPEKTPAAGYKAFRGRTVVLEARSLAELAKGLRKLGINPRNVEIRSKEPVPAVEKLGLRLTGRTA
jgi:plasmid stability protein